MDVTLENSKGLNLIWIISASGILARDILARDISAETFCLHGLFRICTFLAWWMFRHKDISSPSMFHQRDNLMRIFPNGDILALGHFDMGIFRNHWCVHKGTSWNVLVLIYILAPRTFWHWDIKQIMMKCGHFDSENFHCAVMFPRAKISTLQKYPLE
jgi:hypothetical protein